LSNSGISVRTGAENLAPPRFNLGPSSP